MPTTVGPAEDAVDDSSSEPTRRLAELINHRRQLDAAIDYEIEQLADTGTGWPAIANALGVTRQAARQRQQRRRHPAESAD